jgi:hypothetical protein
MQQYNLNMLVVYSLKSKSKESRFGGLPLESLELVTSKAKGLRRWINHLRAVKQKRAYRDWITRFDLVPDLTAFPEGFRRLALTAFANRRQALARKTLSCWRDYLDTSKKLETTAETFRANCVAKFGATVLQKWHELSVTSRQSSDRLGRVIDSRNFGHLGRILEAWRIYALTKVCAKSKALYIA